MSTIRARHPALRLLRLALLAGFALSLIGLVLGLLGVMYAAAWGCHGSSVGWLPCTVSVAMLPLAAAGSAFMTLVLLVFVQLFYMAGAKVSADGPPGGRGSVRGFFADLIVDIVD